MKKCTLFFTLSLISAACGSREPRVVTPDAETVIVQAELSPKKVYFFAPELDEKTCRATGGCDCCSSHLLFADEAHFVLIDYCMMDETYSTGSYAVRDGKIELTFDRLYVDRVYDESASQASDVPEKYEIRTGRRENSEKLTIGRSECSGRPILRMQSGEKLFGTIDPETDARELIGYMKKGGVWSQLDL